MNDITDFKYQIPSDILAKFTGEFLDIFAGELLQVFWPGDKRLDILEISWITGTVGWHRAFSKACEKLNMTEVLKYYEDLEWYDSDIFDDEICRLLKGWMKRK